jgi:hypothetical protein
MKTELRILPKLPLAALLSLSILLLLSGCFQARLVLDVDNEGAGTLTATLGIDQIARQQLQAAGADPWQRYLQSLQGPDGSPLPGMNLETWQDQGLDWARVTVQFFSPEDLSQRMQQTGLFDTFMLEKRSSLLHDEYVLNARLKTMQAQDLPQGIPLSINPDDYQLEMLVRMPGNIQQTNGMAVEGDSQAYLWQILLTDPVWVQVSSRVVNWINVGLLALGALLVVLVIVLVFVARTFMASRQRGSTEISPVTNSGVTAVRWQAASNHTDEAWLDEVDMPQSSAPSISAEELPVPAGASPLERFGTRKILAEFNGQVLGGAGQIEVQANQMVLSWPPTDSNLQPPAIRVTMLGDWLVTVNGQPVTMNAEGIRQGVAKSFRQLHEAGRA